MAKLTLSIESDRIEKAKQYASKHHTSISKMVSDFLDQVIERGEVNGDDLLLKKLNKLHISDEVKALSGILKGKYPDDLNFWDAKYEYLKEKHDL